MESSQDIADDSMNDPPPLPPNPIQQPQINNPAQSSVYQQQQLYAQYIQQQRIVMIQEQQRQYLAQQRYMAQYIAQQKQLQQQQYNDYYQQIYRQYGHAAMLQAMQQNSYSNMPMEASRSSNGQIILSAEEQPLLLSASNSKRKGRKRKRPQSPTKARREILIELNEHGFDEYTLINKDEELPNREKDFDEWLHFTKQLWQRQRKYKKGIMSKEEKEILELEESLSCGDMTLSPTSCGKLQIKSSFLADRIRRMKSNVLKNKKVVNIMIKMGLAPPWNQMSKYKKWKGCYDINKSKK